MMTTIWAGLSIGAIYALVAIGYNITLVLTGVLNFAQGQFLVVGAFLGYWGLTQQGLPLPFVLLLAVIAGALIAMLEERIAIRPLKGSKAHTELVTTLGFAAILSGIALAIWGSEPLRVSVVSTDTLTLLGGRVRMIELVVIALAVISAVAFHQWTNRTRLGLAGLARTEDNEAATLRGIDVRRLSILGFAIAGAFGAFVGVFAAQKTFAVFSLGMVLALKGFAAMAIGGIGNHYGALLGGLGVGLVEVFAARYIGNDYGDIAVFVVLFAALVFKPTGLLSRGEARLV